MMDNDDHDRPWVNRRGGWIARYKIPYTAGHRNAGGGITMGHFAASSTGQADLVEFYIDNPDGENHGYYRVQDKDNSWSDRIEVPGWFGSHSAGGGITVGDIDDNGIPDLIICHIDNPDKENHGYYRIGFNPDSNGISSDWADPVQIPGWFGWETAGAGITIGNIDDNPRLDLVVFHIDNNTRAENTGHYRIGWNLGNDGVATSWTDPIEIPGWFGAETSGGGITMGDFTGSGRPNLIVYHVDNPNGDNHGYYRVSDDLDPNGERVPSWTKPNQIPGWFGDASQGGGITMGLFDADDKEDLVVFHIDNPKGDNYGYYRVGLHKDKSRRINPFSVK